MPICITYMMSDYRTLGLTDPWIIGTLPMHTHTHTHTCVRHLPIKGFGAFSDTFNIVFPVQCQ